MRTLMLVAATAAALFIPALADARGGGHSAGHSSTYCSACSRGSNGHITRSKTAKRTFEAKTGYPHGRRGYVVDHIIPLKRGGADSPSNMQWQTKSAAKAKDKWE